MRMTRHPRRTEVYGRYSKRAARGQEGMASIVVVSVLIIILTLISIGFSRLISRSITNSANRQYGASATYAAQSGINDVASYLKQYVQANAGSNFLPKSTKCNGNGSLIGSQASPGPFYNDSNLSKDTSRSTAYTCLLLDPTPTSLVYTQVPSLKSQVVKVNTSAAPGALDKLMISWQPSSNQITGFPTSSNTLNDETTWNSAGGVCKDTSNANASCIPILRLSVYPISNGQALNSVQGKSKTVFLYPQKPSSGSVVPIKYYTDTSGDGNSFIDGSLIPVSCSQNVSNFAPANTDYTCNIILGALAGAISPASTDSVYLRLTPIYNQADIKIRANDKFGDNLSFINDQAVIDVTAQTSDVAKRLKAWVNTSSLADGSDGLSANISPGTDAIPEQALRTAIALCKRVVLYNPGNGFNNNAYIGWDDPDAVCHDGNTVSNNPTPSFTDFTITGKNGKDNGRTVDSEANNPDSPQTPPQKGTVYVGDSQASPAGNVTLAWDTKNASVCSGSGGNSGDGWAGNKNAQTTFSGSPSIIGHGSQDLSATYYTEYDLQCSRPGSPGPTDIRKVYAWPYPQVAFNSTSVTAGQDFSLSWNTGNTTSCTAGSSWSGSKSSSKTNQTFSQDMGTWPWNDTNSHTYILTCTDPAGRIATAQITLGKNQSTTCDGGNSSCGNIVNPPPCSAPTAYINPGNNGSGSWFFQGNCPNAAPYSGDYHVNVSNNISNLSSGDVPASQAVPGTMGTISSPGTYCIQLIEWVPGWTTQAAPSGDTDYHCWTIYAPLSGDFGSQYGIWDNSPQCPDLSWWCRNSNTPNLNNALPPICADGVHRFTTCGIWWSVSGGDGNISCQLFSQQYNSTVTTGGSSDPGVTHFGWIGRGNPNPFYLSCRDGSNNRLFITKNIP